MSRVCCSGTSMLGPTLRRALTLAIFLVSGLVYAPEAILAQGSFEASSRIMPSAGPAEPFKEATSGTALFNPNAFPALPGTGLGIRAFGQPMTPFTATTRDLDFKPVAWNRWLLKPSQPAIGIGWFGGSAAGSIGFTGIGHQNGGGFDQFAGTGIGVPQENLPSLFPGAGILPRKQASGTNPGTPPRFDARIASSFSLPLNSDVDKFRLSYRDMFSEGRNALGGNSGTESGSAMFGASNLGNGMFISAGTSYGSRSTTGAAAGSYPGSAAPGGQKHSGPSVGLRLTF